MHGDGDQLRVRFVDPDQGDGSRPEAGAPRDLRQLALEPRADGPALAVLEERIAELTHAVADGEWHQRKESAAIAMQASDFWERDDRGGVLEQLERIDRIEAGVRSAESLAERLRRHAGRGSAELVRRLALLIISIARAIEALHAQQPEDAALELRPTDPRNEANRAWQERLVQMYLHWAKARGYRVQRQPQDPESGALTLKISGFAAWQSLQPEAGLHILDDRNERGERRISVRVRVSSDPPDPSPETEGEIGICRRYEEKPSPLVRDQLRGWRTGRLDRVMGGDFDLFGEESEG